MIIQKDELNFIEFKKILNIIKNDINNNCIGKVESANYSFKKNLLLQNILKILKSKFENYEIQNQIINYENKTVALLIFNKINSKTYYLPCYPSSIKEDIDILFIEHGYKYNNYNDTIDFLKDIYTKSNNIINVNPLYKIIDKGLIVGVITNGNQFVAIDPPDLYSKEDDDGLEILDNKDYIVNDLIYNKLDEKIQTEKCIIWL